MGDVLTEDIIYDAADVLKENTPFENIKFFSISVQQFRDISIITRMTSLRIVQFRLCSIRVFPEEFFSMPNLESIDLSGNSISFFAEDGKWDQMLSLKTLNLSENNISEINEITKLSGIPNIRHLILSGNICLSANNAFDRIVEIFPTLDVLNDSIITSQHRGYIKEYCDFNHDSLVPLTKADDFIFAYVKYMHSTANERLVRRHKAQFFCIHKVLRRYSAALKIQSVFRGIIERRKWKNMRSKAIFLETFIRYWYLKRNKAAIKIQGAFRYFKLRRVIIEYRNARKIQSAWRTFTCRDEAIVNVFEINENTFKVYLTNESYQNLIKFCNSQNFTQIPKLTNDDEFRVIRIGPLKKRILPGSPVVYYNIDDNVLVRRNRRHLSTTNSIWCNHDHKTLTVVEQVSHQGVNYTKYCPYSVIQYLPFTNAIRPLKTKSGTFLNYENLKYVQFTNRSIFHKFVSIISHSLPEGIILFPYMSLNEASSQLTVHSTIRMILERKREFLQMKKYAIEKRAAKCIVSFVRSSRLKRFISHISNILHYSDVIPESMTFFVTQEFLDQINEIPIKFAVEYGFNSDHCLVLSREKTDPFLANFIPTDDIVYRGNRFIKIVKAETIIRPAIPSMFSIPVSRKTIQKGKIRRITFLSPEEAFRRLFLFAFMTGNFNQFMTDSQVVEYCAAVIIQNHWRGHILRREYRHFGAQAGKVVNPAILLKMEVINTSNQKKDQVPQTFKNFMRPEVPPEVVIANLRGDYRPWEKIRGYKNYPPYEPPPDKPKYEEEEQVFTESMRNMGMTKDFDNALENSLVPSFDTTSPNLKDYTYNEYNNMNSTNFDSSVHEFYQKRRPATAIKKPPKFEIELESQNIFRSPISKIKALDPYLPMATLPMNPEAITPIDRSEEAFALAPLSLPKRSMVKDDSYKSPPPLKNRKQPEVMEKTPHVPITPHLETLDELPHLETLDESPQLTPKPLSSAGKKNKKKKKNKLQKSKTMVDPTQESKKTKNSYSTSALPINIPESSQDQTSTDTNERLSERSSSKKGKSKAKGKKKSKKTPAKDLHDNSLTPASAASNISVTPSGLLSQTTQQNKRPGTSTLTTPTTSARPKIIEPISQTSSTKPTPTIQKGQVKGPKALIDLSKGESSTKKKDPTIHVPTPKLQTTHYTSATMQNSDFSESLVPQPLGSAGSTVRPSTAITTPNPEENLSNQGAKSSKHSITSKMSITPMNSLKSFNSIISAQDSTPSFATEKSDASDISFSVYDMRYPQRPSSVLMTTSPQWTDNSFRDALRRACTKLVRLHQLGIQIEQAMVVDNTIAEKAAAAFQARSKIQLAREARGIQKVQELQDLIDRNKIEQFEREEQVKQVRARTALTRTRNATKVRTVHKEAITKYKKERDFALHFVSVSRQVAQVVEQRHMKEERRRQLEDAANSVSKHRTETKQLKEKFHQKVKDMEEDRRKVVARDKLINEEKRAIQTEAHQRRIEMLSELKENAKLMKDAYHEYKSQKKVVSSNIPPPLETDEIEGAALIIGGYIGENLGEVEAHLLCEIISQIV
ncbi:hypothetical protein TRFO_23733 [Tritrichomonas foetus]|uniref:IQ calmodulin-binding motif family protein n=1 Tax=Tritrichomonas foetus TaxID=1144522 RepID=A0A1J4KA76_9EUKA|nr:hypothetical protein TRFO_23733 [Tritrichomonas foetus]|eukprot:OHT07874.1 hypothetical protein TRFO_23733 [Tritrichomonas foetus]